MNLSPLNPDFLILCFSLLVGSYIIARLIFYDLVKMTNDTFAVIYALCALVSALNGQYIMVPVWISLSAIYQSFDDETDHVNKENET